MFEDLEVKVQELLDARERELAVYKDQFVAGLYKNYGIAIPVSAVSSRKQGSRTYIEVNYNGFFLFQIINEAGSAYINIRFKRPGFLGKLKEETITEINNPVWLLNTFKEYQRYNQ